MQNMNAKIQQHFRLLYIYMFINICYVISFSYCYYHCYYYFYESAIIHD